MQMSLVAFAFLMNSVWLSPQPPEEAGLGTFRIQQVRVEVVSGESRAQPDLQIAVQVVLQGGELVPPRARRFPVLLIDDQRLEMGGAGTIVSELVKPGQSRTVELTARIPALAKEEPRLRLWLPGMVPEHFADRVVWKDAENAAPPEEGVEDFALNLNQYFREDNPLKSTRCGPDGVLEVIAVGRNLDMAAAWVLFEFLKKRGGDSAERLVIVPLEGRTIEASEEIVSWIAALAREDAANAPTAILPTLGKPLRFSATGGMLKPQAQRFSGNTGTRGLASGSYATADEAIRHALTPVYRFASVERAIADLRSDVAGIRRAALAGSVDRLTEQQARVLIEFAHSGSVERQLEVAAYLNQIPGPEAIVALRELSLGEDERVASTALAGLANSLNVQAVAAMSEIWEAGQQRPVLRSLAASEMADSLNDRWIPLLTSYVDEFLELAVQGHIAGHTPDQLRRVLLYLSDRNSREVDQQIRNRIEAIALTPFQDVLIWYLRQQQDPESIEVIRRVVTSRLQAGLVSDNVEGAATDLRDPAWTELFLADYYRKRVAGTNQNTLRCVLACATPEQITEIAARTAELDDSAIEELLRYMAATGHPGFRTLAAAQLQRRGNTSINAIQVLGADASEDSLKLLIDSARRHVAELEGTRDASVEGQQYLQILLDYLATFAHPECRRLINQLCRDRNVWVRELAQERYRNAISRSPAMRFLFEENQAREAGDLKAASEALESALKQDPFLAEAWLRRSSERMHAGEFEAALADLQRAGELSPESTEVTSMIALVMIRVGRVDEGLKTTEELVRQAPEDDFALYNGACAYARAAERPDVASEKQQQYVTRAIELLKKTNETGFTDFEHLAADVDLNVLHQHPEWNALLEGARANAAKKAAPQE